MPTPNQEAVVKALTDFIALGREVGLPKVIQPLEQYAEKFRATKPSFKTLRDSVKPQLDKGYLAIRDRVCDLSHNPRKGRKKQSDELDRTFRALDDLIYPPRTATTSQTEIVGLADNKETTSVLGDPAAAKAIAKKSIGVVKKFSKAVFDQQIDAAHQLSTNESQIRQSAKRLAADLQKADAQFGGPAVDLMIERITWIYADDASRQKPNSEGDWPKETPAGTKRALVGAFWFTNKKTRHGRSAFFWITEEPAGYRIAKFKQYRQ